MVLALSLGFPGDSRLGIGRSQLPVRLAPACIRGILMPKIGLDLCLNDGRDYVQGVQILSAALAAVPQGDSLSAAAFKTLTDRQVDLTVGETPSLNELGCCWVNARGGSVRVGFEAQPDRAPRRTLPSSAHIGEGQGGRFSYSATGNVSGLLDIMVQTVKRTHQQASPNCRDLWFTGFRGAELPAHWPGGEGEAQVEIVRKLQRGPRWQSVSRVLLTGFSPPIFVSFCWSEPCR